MSCSTVLRSSTQMFTTVPEAEAARSSTQHAYSSLQGCSTHNLISARAYPPPSKYEELLLDKTLHSRPMRKQWQANPCWIKAVWSQQLSYKHFSCSNRSVLDLAAAGLSILSPFCCWAGLDLRLWLVRRTGNPSLSPSGRPPSEEHQASCPQDMATKTARILLLQWSQI